MTTQSQIDAVVAALSDSGADLSSPTNQGHAGLIFNSADDSYTQTSPGPAPGMTPQPIPDDGRDLAVAHAEIMANYNQLSARLDEGTYDAVTGEKKFSVTGRDREVLELQVKQAKTSGAYDISRLQALHQQRVQNGQRETAPVQMSDGKVASLQEAAARAAYIDGAPPGQRVQFAADYDRMMREAAVRNVTNAISAATRR
jgi:hypothetical protein